jgi:hypothetical protein
MMSPKESKGSDSSAAADVGWGATTPEFASGFTTSLVSFLASLAAVAGGAGGAALESSDPTWSCFLYLVKMESLWYFQNCLEASFPATRWRTEVCQRMMWSMILVIALFFPPGCSSWNFVRSYTSSSTMMYRSLAVLCDATSATENRCDMFAMM